METPPRSWLRRTTPRYTPAKTPYVGKQVPLIPRHTHEADYDYSYGKPTSYWVAPILPDGTLGKMTTAPLTRAELKG